MAIVFQVKIQDINQLKQFITNAITSINLHVLECVLQQCIEMRFQLNYSHVEHNIKRKMFFL